MILWALVVGGSVVLVFSFVIAFGAPFLPTLKQRIDDAIDLLDLKKGQTLLELGSGDGRIAKRAAINGAKVIGYELNPLLVIYSRLVCFRYRKQVKIIWGNYWLVKWPKADAIYVFLLNPYMAKLHKKITQEVVKKTRVVSFVFKIPGQKIVKNSNSMLLYVYDRD